MGICACTISESLWAMRSLCSATRLANSAAKVGGGGTLSLGSAPRQVACLATPASSEVGQLQRGAILLASRGGWPSAPGSPICCDTGGHQASTTLSGGSGTVCVFSESTSLSDAPCSQQASASSCKVLSSGVLCTGSPMSSPTWRIVSRGAFFGLQPWKLKCGCGTTAPRMPWPCTTFRCACVWTSSASRPTKSPELEFMCSAEAHSGLSTQSSTVKAPTRVHASIACLLRPGPWPSSILTSTHTVGVCVSRYPSKASTRMEWVLTLDRCVRMCAIICPRNTKEPSELAPTKVTSLPPCMHSVPPPLPGTADTMHSGGRAAASCSRSGGSSCAPGGVEGGDQEPGVWAPGRKR